MAVARSDCPALRIPPETSNHDNFELSIAAGHERRTTGSYYTQTSLIDCLLDSALDPILDEATSALDNETERSVMEAIGGLQRDLTILLIAHRLTTVRHCDTIAELEDGRIIAQAPYEELLQCSQSFRRMAHATEST